MADGVQVTVKGLPEVLARLKEATFDLQNKSARRAVGNAARNTAKVAARNAAALRNTKDYQHTGTLARAIIGHWSPKRSKEYLVHVGLVRARSGKYLRKRKKGSQDAYYAGWVEFGHLSVARRKGKYTDLPLRGLGRATGISVRRREAQLRAYETKGAERTVRPHPFMAPAWSATKTAALRIIEETLRRDLNRAAKGK